MRTTVFDSQIILIVLSAAGLTAVLLCALMAFGIRGAVSKDRFDALLPRTVWTAEDADTKLIAWQLESDRRRVLLSDGTIVNTEDGSVMSSKTVAAGRDTRAAPIS